MYLPTLFKQQDTEACLRLMQSAPFATVITVVDGTPFVSHLPVLAERHGDSAELVITGHLARANPHWRHFESSDAETLFIFHGPHTYVTPSWYPDPLNVPTWNYAVVHAYARPRLVEDYGALHAILARTVDEMEKLEPKPWRFDVPEDFKQDLARGIVGFEAPVTRLEGKFKLSQNREPADREGVIQGLATRTDEQSRGALKWMTEPPPR
jgi:transcriptional regulator